MRWGVLGIEGALKHSIVNTTVNTHTMQGPVPSSYTQVVTNLQV